MSAKVRIRDTKMERWWKGPGKGYTKDLAKAAFYSREDAESILESLHRSGKDGNEMRSHCNSSVPPTQSEEATEKKPDWYWLAPDGVVHSYHPTKNSVTACELDWDGWTQVNLELGVVYDLCGKCRQVFEKLNEEDEVEPEELTSEQIGERLKIEWEPYHKGRCYMLSKGNGCQCHLCLVDTLTARANDNQPKLKLAAASLREDELRKELRNARDEIECFTEKIEMLEIDNEICRKCCDEIKANAK